MTSNKKVSIAMATDDQYAQFAGVAMTSLFENRTSRYDCDIYILEDGLSQTNRENLANVAAQYNAQVSFLRPDSRRYHDLVLTDHYTIVTYFRLDLPRLLPDLQKILFFDCDMIIRRDILKLWELDLTDYYLAASGRSHKSFNAGLMLMNLDRWRADDIPAQVTSFIRENRDLIQYVDQSGLNAVFSAKPWLLLPYRWNVRTGQLDAYLDTIKRKELSDEERASVRDPYILHYTGPLKPWDYRYSFKYDFLDEYVNYLRLTPWKKYQLQNHTAVNVCKRYYHRSRRFTAQLIGI